MSARTDLRHRFHAPLLACLLFPCLLLLFAGCSMNVSASATSPLEEGQAQAATSRIEQQFFGMVVKSPGSVSPVAVGSRRLWDAGVTWAALEPTPGVFAWEALDAEVAAAESAGQQVVLTLGMTPAWGSSSPARGSAYGAGATAMPANIADWDAYVSAVAARYAGRIAAYEVWNAPEDSTYWSGDPAKLGADMVTLAQHAGAAVHAADPAALLVSPALSSAGLAAFLQAGGGASVNVVGVQLDPPGATPEQMADSLTGLRQTMEGTSAADKPVWNEQAAWQLPSGGLGTDEQAAYVARALLLNAGFGVARMHWYAWDDTTANALALNDGSAQPTRAALAYTTVESWLAGAVMNGCSSSAQGVWTCQIVQGAKTGWIVWSPDGVSSSSSYGATTETDLDGVVTSLAGNSNVEVGFSPVLLQ